MFVYSRWEGGEQILHNRCDHWDSQGVDDHWNNKVLLQENMIKVIAETVEKEKSQKWQHHRNYACKIHMGKL